MARLDLNNKTSLLESQLEESQRALSGLLRWLDVVGLNYIPQAAFHGQGGYDVVMSAREAVLDGDGEHI